MIKAIVLTGKRGGGNEERLRVFGKARNYTYITDNQPSIKGGWEKGKSNGMEINNKRHTLGK